MADRKWYIIAYDISDTKLRQQLVQILLDYGQRVQYSIFVCKLTSFHYRDLEKRIQRLMKKRENVEGMKKVVAWQQNMEESFGDELEYSIPEDRHIVIVG